MIGGFNSTPYIALILKIRTGEGIILTVQVILRNKMRDSH